MVYIVLFLICTNIWLASALELSDKFRLKIACGYVLLTVIFAVKYFIK